MPHFSSLREGLPVFKALNSEVRVSIMEMLYKEGSMHMTAIADRLKITGGALTPHIKALADCGLVTVEMAEGKHGVQKICSAVDETIVIEPTQQRRNLNIYETEIGVGQYTAYSVSPTCGICTPDHIIGQVDDPRYFASPERINADILWFGHGFVEYMLPCFLRPDQEPVEIQISMEISSEAPGCSDDWPSDVYFHMNGKELGFWTSPGDFGRIQGIYNPSWWFRNWNQHGLYKLLSINNTGTFMDGGKISDTRLKDLDISGKDVLSFRISVPETAKNVGGFTVFGRSFGNYPQDIKMRMHYRDREERT